MRIYRTLIALALTCTLAGSPSVGPALAQLHSPGAATVEEAVGLKVAAVRPLTEPNGIEIVFAEPSAEVLRGFSRRAAGHDVDFFVGGQRIATLKLRDPILGNSVMLTGEFSGEFRKALEEATQKGVDIKLHL